MSKWIINYNDDIDEFSDFSEAVSFFKARIRAYIINSDTVFNKNYLPVVYDSIYEYKKDALMLNDKEIIGHSYFEILMNRLNFNDDLKIININKIKMFNKKVDLKIIDPILEDKDFYLVLSIDKNNDMISLLFENYENNELNQYLYSNAFVFNNRIATYFFESSQQIFVADWANLNKLGRKLDFKIRLEYIEE